MGGKTLQAEGSDCAPTARGTGRSHQVSQANFAGLMGTLVQIQTGPPRIRRRDSSCMSKMLFCRVAQDPE